MARATDELIRFVDCWQPRRIVVAGDFMLDRYTYGNADRLSPDAPVPVLAVKREEHMPGGAANVCRDLRALRCEVACLGVIGDDEAGRTLARALDAEGCDTAGLLVTDRPTTLKHSYIGLAQHRHPQKMFRVDTEQRDAIGATDVDRLAAAARPLLKDAAALCLEDYNKGVLSPSCCRALIALAKEMGVPVLVDPASIADYDKYAGATCITPNRTEAALATGADLSIAEPSHWQAVARELLWQLELDAVVITLDKHGAVLAERNAESDTGAPSRHVATKAREVYDVTGAGDMVLAMLAAARGSGADWPTAVELANIAGGLEVEKFGVVPIPIDEILLALLAEQHEQLGKVRTIEQLLPELEAHRRAGKRVAFTNGCFDVLHAGHVKLLRDARRTADLLVLAVNTDVSIRQLKGPERPIVNETDRLFVLSELESVDYLITFGDGEGGEGDTPIPLLKAIQPEVLVKGGDYTREQVVGHELVDAYGGEIVLVRPVEGRSSTNVIEKIRASNK